MLQGKLMIIKIKEINMFRALTKNLDVNEILDLLADNHVDTAYVYLEPPENSEGFDDSEDEGHPTQISGRFYRLEKSFNYFNKIKVPHLQ